MSQGACSHGPMRVCGRVCHAYKEIYRELASQCELIDAYWAAGEPEPKASGAEPIIEEAQDSGQYRLVEVALPNGDGSITGLAVNHTQIFRGIRYAKPPLGALRFLPPEKNEPWAPKKLDATGFKPNCMQQKNTVGKSPFGLNGTFNEDCLYLNVFMPAAPTGSERFPVLIILYAADNHEGGANDERFDAWNLAGHLHMVIVTFNYRLGVRISTRFLYTCPPTCR